MLQTWFSDILVTNEDEGGKGIRNWELRITNCHATNQNQGHQGNQENHGSDKIMLQTWFSDILVANEDERRDLTI